MRSVLIAAAAALALAAPAFAQQGAAPAPAKAPAGAYVLDKPHASLLWKGLHQGLSFYSARFNTFDIQLDFNPDDVTKSKITATIDPKSIETDDDAKRASGQSKFDSELADGATFFNSAKFPQITFASTAITKSGDNTGKMTGDLTFLGVTKPVTLDVTMNGGRADARTQKFKVGFTATGSLKRSDFGMSPGGSLADEIRLEINAELIQK